MKPLVAALGVEIREYACDDEFFREDAPQPGSWVVVYPRWPAIRLLDFIERLRPVERGIECVVAGGDGFVAAMVEAVKAGAVDVINGSGDSESLIDRLKERVRKNQVLGDSLGSAVGRNGSGRKNDTDRVGPVVSKQSGSLTPSNGRPPPEAAARSPMASALASPRGLTLGECRVLRMLAAGKPRRVIAARLRRTVKTVNAHCASIRRKLQIAEDEDLALVAKRLVPPP